MTCWRRSLCEGAEYPAFSGETAITTPDYLEEMHPEFSGFARYETDFEAHGEDLVLEITNTAEGVEIFVNGKSAGIQIVPPFRYDLTALAQSGRNLLTIEVATTLERECYYKCPGDPMTKNFIPTPAGKVGLTGEVKLYRTKA